MSSDTIQWIPSEIPYNIFVDCAGDSISAYTTQEYLTSNSCITYSHILDSRDYEIGRFIDDHNYFERVLFDEFNKKIIIDPERDLDDYRELRIKLINQMKNILRKFLDRGIIKNFSIYRVFREIDFITVEFGVLKNNEWLKIEKSFRDESKNYGFR